MTIMRTCDYCGKVSEIGSEHVLSHLKTLSKRIDETSRLVRENKLHFDSDYCINNFITKNSEKTVMQLAVELEQLQVLKCLVENGADIHKNDDAALRLAKEKGYTKIVEYIESL